MSLFQTVLGQLQEKLLKKHAHKETLIQIITEVVGVSITVDQVEFRDGVLIIKVPPTLKFAIKTKEQAIIKACSTNSITVNTISLR